MRKCCRYIVFALGLMLSFVSPAVHAAGYSVYLAGGGTFTDSASLTLSVSGSASMGGACGGICGVTGVLSYDRSKIELTAASGLQGFDFTQGASIVLYKSTAAYDGGILSLRFRNVGLASGESTTVTVSGISVTNGDTEVGVGSAARTIQYVAPAPSPAPATDSSNAASDSHQASNSAAPSASSAAQSSSSSGKRSSDNARKDDANKDNDSDESSDDGGEEEKIEEKKSGNASLASIELSVGEMDFDKDILSYDIIVENDTEEIVINAVTEDGKATVDGIGTFRVKYGNNEYKIVVTAEDGTEKEYIIKVYRDGAAEAIAEQEQKILALTIVLCTVVAVIVLAVVAAMGWLVIRRYKSNGKKDDSASDKGGSSKI